MARRDTIGSGTVFMGGIPPSRMWMTMDRYSQVVAGTEKVVPADLRTLLQEMVPIHKATRDALAHYAIRDLESVMRQGCHAALGTPWTSGWEHTFFDLVMGNHPRSRVDQSLLARARRASEILQGWAVPVEGDDTAEFLFVPHAAWTLQHASFTRRTRSFQRNG
jgi:hypothetical protein